MAKEKRIESADLPIIALAGNPNSGKTTLFNSLTGSSAYVGNWPGVTVAKREGIYKGKAHGGKAAKIVDLPGIYSLSPYTPEERVSREFICSGEPSCVICVVDATNLERNLYLATQILEMDVPAVIALNMSDALEKDGGKIDVKKLSDSLGVPVVSISALQKTNLDLLMNVAFGQIGKKRDGETFLPFKTEIEKAKSAYVEEGIANPLFHAIKALEGDELEEKENHNAYLKAKEGVSEELSYQIADERYKFLSPLVKKAFEGKRKQGKEKLSLSDKIDKVLTNKWAALPIMALLMFLIFHIVFGTDLLYIGSIVEAATGHTMFSSGFGGVSFEVGGETYQPFADLFYSAEGINNLGEFLHMLAGDNATGILGCISLGIKQLLIVCNSPEWLIGFIYDGVLGGVAAVLGFVPQIMLLFAFFAFLEDSGYMARVAFVLDRIFRRFGVSGRAFLPMIMGFGCGIPAMMNTRTLASYKERLKTIRVIPFFTCGAKAEFLVIIGAVIASAVGFDPGIFTFLIYLFGVAVALLALIVMTKTTLREKAPPFIMELPSYHLPQPGALTRHTLDRGSHFIKKAFTIIFASTVIVWFLASFTWDYQMVSTLPAEVADSSSILASIGQLLQPLFTPLGFGVQAGEGGWIYAVASIQGMIAKENVVATSEALAQSLGYVDFAAFVESSNVSVAGLIGFAVFNMLTIPCFASVATAKGELNDRKSYYMTLLFWLGLSYGLGCLAYITFEWVWTLGITLPLAAGAITGLYFYDKSKARKEAAC